MSWNSTYPSVVNTSTLSTLSSGTGGNNINLRQEFLDLIYGTGGDDPIGQNFLLRRMRRDDDGELVPCICVDEVTQEPDRDFPCPYCLGAGNLWDEEVIVGYKSIAASPGGGNSAANFPKHEGGTMSVPAVRFFLPHTIEPTREDRIIIIKLDLEGNPVHPIERTSLYELFLVRAMREENAQVAYWICSGNKMGPETYGYVG